MTTPANPPADRSPQGLADRIPLALSYQGDGRERERLRACGDRGGPGASIPDFDASTIELRDSRAGNYLGVTITITATSREQLDDLYRALSSHPMVKVVL
ncbi:hypothetical protein ALISP_5936 [Alicycliphilus sp. B1]|nr:hypothetical protein ALISP_5936 [Alicycliphilus sp. B1]